MKQPRLDLFVFADALGWELSKRYSFMDNALPIRNKCETVFGYSSTCDPTILTGVMPSDHDHFSFFVKADGQNPSPFSWARLLSLLPEKIAGYHRVRNFVSRYVAKSLGYTGYFQLYSVPFSRLPHLDYTEKKDIYEPGGIRGGQDTIFKLWNDTGKPWGRSNWRLSDEENLEEARRKIASGSVALYYLFTASLDATMHRYGTHNENTKKAFDTFSENLTNLLSLAEGEYETVNLYVFSDHGMCDVAEACDTRTAFEHADFEYGRDYTAVWDSTMARFWFHSEKARDEIGAWFDARHEGQWVSDEQLEEWGCLFEDRKYGERFYLLHPGHLFVPSFLNQGFVTGMHGYAPEHQDSAACWLTNNPGAPKVGELKDIYQVMKEAALS